METLLADLESTVNTVLSYFEGPGQTSTARVGDWGSWEVLAHFLYWHESTARGMESVISGAGPFTVAVETDAMNAESIERHRGETIPDLVRQARELQDKVVAAARQINDLDTVILERPERTATARQRLETLVRHWRGHVAALQGAE
jgi:hypothetical protein